MSKREKPCVVFACDEGVALPLAVAIRSLSDNCSSRDLEIYVIDGGLSDSSKANILASCPDRAIGFRAPLHPAVNVVGSMAGHVTPSAHLRFQIPQLFPDRSRAIYLDADTLVLGDVSELWSIRLPEDCPFGAIIDMGAPCGFPGLEEHGFGTRGYYFNNGVMLMNLEVLRREEVDARASAFVEQFRPPLADQDALNVLFEHRWLSLPPRWNAQLSAGYQYTRFLSEEDFLQAASNPGIVHFAGAIKPWHLDSQWLRHAEKWWLYADRTVWPREEKDRYSEESTYLRFAGVIHRRLAMIEAAHPTFDRGTFLAQVFQTLERYPVDRSRASAAVAPGEDRGRDSR